MEPRTSHDFFEQPIFIVGAARSGTSMVANVFNRSGMWVGETVKGSPENPAGYFENKRIRDGMVKPFLAANGYDRFGRDPLPPETLELEGVDLPGMLREHLESEGYQYHVPWGYKDCKLLLMWKAWHRVFPKARWIFVDRYKADIIESCTKTSFMMTGGGTGAEDGPRVRDEAFFGDMVDRYRLGYEEMMKDTSVECYEVSADDIIAGDYDRLLSVIKSCGLRSSKERIGKVIKPDFWNRSEEEMYSVKKNEDGQHRLELKMGMNTSRGYILDNIETNIRRQLPQVKEHPLNEQKLILVAGGPSLVDTLDEIKDCVEQGGKLVAFNGTHDWLVEQGLKPSAMIMVDSRPTNARFVEKPIKSCKYFIASQCHPDVFEALKDNEVHIWHANNGIGEEQILEDYYLKQFRFIIGGSTVLLRGIWLMRTLGFKQMDVFGFDSCYMDNKHHAYDQPENDGCEIQEVTCMGKKFQCAAWMASQFDDYQHFIKSFGDKFELNVHGNGLIAHMMHEGAKLFEQEVKTATGG